jgi:hypothetical protein
MNQDYQYTGACIPYTTIKMQLFLYETIALLKDHPSVYGECTGNIMPKASVHAGEPLARGKQARFSFVSSKGEGDIIMGDISYDAEKQGIEITWEIDRLDNPEGMWRYTVCIR